MLKKALTLLIVAEVLGLFFYQFHSVSASPLEEAQFITRVCKDAVGEQVSHEKCTAKGFADLAEKKGIAHIGDVLAAYQSINKGYQGYENCHVLSHRIMNDLGTRKSGGWKELIEKMGARQLDPTRCGGGFMHGALEVRASEDPSFKVGAPLFTELCTETLPSELSSSCAHILGHLALVESLGVLNEALKACDGLSGEYLFQCYGGIFMEDSMRTNLEVHGLASLPERNLEWLRTQRARCDRFKNDPEIARGCWYDLPEVFAQTHHYDLVKTYKFCSEAPNKAAYDDCYIRASYLIAIAPDSLFEKFPNQEMCADYKEESPKLFRCVYDVVGAQLTGSLSFLDRTLDFCEARPQKAEEHCFGAVAQYIQRYSKDSKEISQTLCAKLPETFHEACLKKS